MIFVLPSPPAMAFAPSPSTSAFTPMASSHAPYCAGTFSGMPSDAPALKKPNLLSPIVPSAISYS